MKREFTKLMAALMLLVTFCLPLGMNGQTRTEEVIYTLEPVATGGNSAPHNSYTAEATVTINNIEWAVMGNSSMVPWRIGGKSISNVNRPIYSKTAIQDNVSKIEVTHGAASSITVNSWTVIVASDASFSNVVSTLTPTFAANTTTTITRPANADWSNCYYKFVYNVTVSGSSNKFVEFTRAKFYAETGAAAYNVTINSMMNGTVQSSHQTATPNTTVTLTPQPATNYALGSIDVTGSPSGNTPSGGLTNNGNGTYSFTMPNEDVYVGATFLPATTVTIDDTNLTNLDILNGTNAGSLTATVTENVNNTAVSGATVTWASSDTNVATVNNGTITLVGIGTTNITATYAGNQSYAGSVGIYPLTVINGMQVSYDFTSVQNFFTDANLTTHPGTGSGSNLTTYYYSNGDMFTASGTNHYFNSGYFMLGKTDALLDLPTFQGYKITQVIAHSSSGCSTNVSIAIVDDEGTVVANAQQWGQNGTYTYVIPAASQTSPLSLKVTTAYNAQITGITLVRENLGVITDTEITVPQGFNTDVYQSTTGGVLTAAVTYDNNGTTTNVPNATVTWASSDTNVATVNQNGVVTLVAAGTTDITATYAGDATYAPSSDTYQLVVTNSGPVVTATGNLTNFIYAENYGPSAAQTIEVSGTHLSFNISVELDNGANSAFEMSTDNTTWQSTVTLTQTNGTVAPTTVYIRMKAGKVAYQYSDVARVKYNYGTHASFNLIGDVITPMSVADAIDAIDNAPNNQVSGAYVLGIISEVVSYQSNYNSITYWISDDGESNVLQVYSGLGLNGAPFSALTDLSVGDEVVVYGNLKLHNNSVYEFDYNNYLVSYTAHQAQQFTLAVTSVSNATIDVFDATDPDETNWVWLFDGVGSDQVTEGTQIGLSVIANNGYAIEHLMVNNVDHAADITSGGTYTFNMPAQNVTITVTTVPAYTISFYVNGSVDNTLEMTIPQATGATLGTLPTPAAASIPTGFEFCGWMVKPVNDYYSASTAPTMVNGSTAVSADMDLAAVFAQTDNSNLTIGELTATEIADEFANGNHAYADLEVEYEDGDFTWAAMYSANNGRHWIQLKNDADVYLKIEAPSNIQSVEVVISNSSNQSGGIDDITMHGNYDATGYIYLNTTNGGTHVGTTAGSAVVNNHATIVPSGNNTTLYLQVDKSARIWGVTVSCGQLTYVDYTTLVVNHADNTTIADNAAETLYGIHYINGYVLAGDDVTNSGKLIITANGQLDMDAYTLTNATAANLVIEDGGQVICGNAFAGTMLKDIIAYPDVNGNAGYYIFASPIEGFVPTAANGFLTQDYDLYAYNAQGDGQGNEWINLENNNGFAGFDAYHGYLYASGQNTTLQFAGILNDSGMNEGFAEVELYYGTQPIECFTLVGNSLASQVTYETVDPVNFLVLNEDGDQFVIESEGATEITLDPMEAVLVYSTTAENYFYEPGFFGSVSPASQSSNVNVKVSRVSGNLLDNAIMSFNGSMMRKLYLSDNSTRVYFPVSNEDYAVVPAQLEGEQPVNFKASENGTYMLTVELNNVELSYLHLIDNMTGADVDLLATPSYTFEAKTTDYASRFRLVFSAEENGASTGSATFAFFNGSEWVVSNTGEATLQVVDVMGRVLSSETVNGNTTISLNQVPGVYMLRLVNGDNVQVQKIVVR